MVQLEMKFNKDKGQILISGVSMAFHCHHYNTNLFQTLADVEYVDGLEILKNAAEKVVFKQFSNLLKEQGNLSWADKLGLAEQIYKTFGFGAINLGSLGEDGIGSFNSPSSHFTKGWLSKFGKRDEPMCHFTSGYVAGIMAAVTGNSVGTFKVNESQCMVTGASECKFVVTK